MSEIGLVQVIVQSSIKYVPSYQIDFSSMLYVHQGQFQCLSLRHFYFQTVVIDLLCYLDVITKPLLCHKTHDVLLSQSDSTDRRHSRDVHTAVERMHKVHCTACDWFKLKMLSLACNTLSKWFSRQLLNADFLFCHLEKNIQLFYLLHVCRVFTYNLHQILVTLSSMFLSDDFQIEHKNQYHVLDLFSACSFAISMPSVFILSQKDKKEISNYRVHTGSQLMVSQTFPDISPEKYFFPDSDFQKPNCFFQTKIFS